jgi:hypothetical protein
MLEVVTLRFKKIKNVITRGSHHKNILLPIKRNENPRVWKHYLLRA